MLSMEKKESDDEAYRYHEKVKYLEKENETLRQQFAQMEGQTAQLSDTLTKDDTWIKSLQDQIR